MVVDKIYTKMYYLAKDTVESFQSVNISANAQMRWRGRMRLGVNRMRVRIPERTVAEFCRHSIKVRNESEGRVVNPPSLGKVGTALYTVQNSKLF